MSILWFLGQHWNDRSSNWEFFSSKPSHQMKLANLMKSNIIWCTVISVIKCHLMNGHFRASEILRKWREILLNYAILNLRVIVCFIEQTKKQGDYSNPYNFKVPTTPFSQRTLNERQAYLHMLPNWGDKKNYINCLWLNGMIF